MVSHLAPTTRWWSLIVILLLVSVKKIVLPFDSIAILCFIFQKFHNFGDE